MSNVAAPVLSPAQLSACKYLCAGGRASAATLSLNAGATPGTLASIVRLGLVNRTEAGARPALYHLTDLGRELVCLAAENDSQGGPNMDATDTALLENETTTAAEDAPASEDAPATPAKRRGRKAAEMTAAAESGSGPADPPAPAAKKATGPTAEMKALYKTVLAGVKGVAGRGSKTTDKAKYCRVGDKNGKTVAYVNFPTSKSVLVEVPKAGESGYTTVSVKTDDDVATAVQAVQDFVNARDAAAAAKAQES